MNFVPQKFYLDLQEFAASYEFDPKSFEALDKRFEEKMLAYDPVFGRYLVEHMDRTGRDIEKFMLRLDYDADTARKIGYAMRKHDGGKIKQPIEYWQLTTDKRNLPPEIKRARPDHTRLGVVMLDETIAELGMVLTPDQQRHMDLTRYTMNRHHERLDGSGPYGWTAEMMDPILRIMTIVDTVDGKFKAKSLTEIFDDLNGSKHEGQFDAGLVCDYEAYCKKFQEPVPDRTLASHVLSR